MKRGQTLLNIPESLRNYPQFLMDESFRQRAMAILCNLKTNSNDVFLDLGCGDGIFTKLLGKQGITFVGFDSSLENLKTAKRVNGIAFPAVLGDAHNLPFRGNAFTKLLCTEVLEHLSDDVSALKEVRRVLKSNGLCLITVPSIEFAFMWDPLNKFFTDILRVSPVTKGLFSGAWFAHKRLYQWKELENKLEKACLRTDLSMGLTHIFFPLNPLLWNLYVILLIILGRKVLRPPRIFSWLLFKADRANVKNVKFEGAVNIMALVHPSAAKTE